MPNDCLNYMTLTGTPEALAKFKASLELPDMHGKSSIFSFHQLVPAPEEEKKNWYNWCNLNWGTKWEPYEIDIYVGDNEIRLSFYTAWSPPEAWVRAACKKIPGLIIKLSYEEPGMDFAGDIWCDGILYRDVPRKCERYED